MTYLGNPGSALGNTSGASVTVGPAASTYPYNGTDLGPQINAAGLALNKAKGGTVYIVGGVGTVYTIATQVIFYNTVNYIGDGCTLKAGSSLLNPFITDTANPYYSGVIASMTLDGNGNGANNNGTTILTLQTCQQSTFYDMVVQNCSALDVSQNPAAVGSYTYTNPSATIPQIVTLTVVSGGDTISALVVNTVSQNLPSPGSPRNYLIYPSGTLTMTISAAGSNALPTVTHAGVGILLVTNPALSRAGYSGSVCGSNAFQSVFTFTCGVGFVLSGDSTGPKQCTNNVFTDCFTVLNTVGGIFLANNTDSNVFTRTLIQLNANYAVGLVFNCANPGNEQNVFFNTFLGNTSVETQATPTGTTGIWTGKNTSKPNFIPYYQPNESVNTTITFVTGAGIHGIYVNDVVNGLAYYGSTWTSGVPTISGNPAPYVVGETIGRSETGADANLLTVQPASAAGLYRVHFTHSVSAAAAAVMGWTVTYTDGSGQAQAPTNLDISEVGSAATAKTITTSAASGHQDYYGIALVAVDNSGTNIVVKTTSSGTLTTSQASAWVERIA